MSLITWVFVGTISGILVGLILRINEQSNVGLNIIIGMVGAIAAGIFITPLFDIVTINQKAFSLPSMMVSLGGALVLLIAVYIFRLSRANAG